MLSSKVPDADTDFPTNPYLSSENKGASTVSH